MKRFRMLLTLILLGGCAGALCGCETLEKKFTRKRKPKGNTEDVVLAPRDYSAHPFSSDILYKQYFVYWKSWNQELVRALGERASQKKVVDCLEQSLVNIKKMKSYLVADKKTALLTYEQKLESMKNFVTQKVSLLPSQLDSLRYDAERILSSVNRIYDPRKMKEFFIDAAASFEEPDL